MKLILLHGLLPLLFSLAEDVPKLVHDGQSSAQVALPAHLLNEAEIQRQLNSGLTTTFRVTARLKQAGEDKNGGCLVEVRYEPWDEVYLVKVIDINSQVSQKTMPSFAAFMEWWGGSRISILNLKKNALQAGMDVSIVLDVLPFSRIEQNHARAWISSAISSGGAKAAAPSNTPGLPSNNQAERSGASSDVLSLIVATSIKRKPLWSYQWTVSIN